MQMNSSVIERLKQNDPTLTDLDLGYRRLTDIDVELLAKALVDNTMLTSLYVSGNQIGAVGAEALSRNQTLTTLYVNWNKIGAVGAAALSRNQTLTMLDVTSNQIGAVGAAALSRNQTLATLDVSNNRIGDAGAEALSRNQTLTTLHVRSNQIGAAGAEALSHHQTLTTLDVGNNQIKDAGAEALSHNQTLTTLDVSDNQIGDAGAEALSRNQTLTKLDVGENELSEEWEKKLEEVIEANRIQVIKRRDQFVQALIILAYESNQRDSGSLWSQLPVELTEYILQQLRYRGREQIGKSDSQISECIRYVYRHIGELKGVLQAARERGESFKVMEKEVGEMREFRFYPSGEGIKGTEVAIRVSEKAEGTVAEMIQTNKGFKRK